MPDDTKSDSSPIIDADSAFSTVVTSTVTSNSTTNKNASTVDYGEDTYGAKFNLSGDASIGEVHTSDFGAIAAAKEIALSGTAAAAEAATRATDAARAGLAEAGKVLTNTSENNIAGILKIGGWIAVGLFAVWLLTRNAKSKGTL